MKVHLWLGWDDQENLVGPFIFTKKKTWPEVKHLFPNQETLSKLVTSEVYLSD